MIVVIDTERAFRGYLQIHKSSIVNEAFSTIYSLDIREARWTDDGYAQQRRQRGGQEKMIEVAELRFEEKRSMIVTIIDAESPTPFRSISLGEKQKGASITTCLAPF